MNRIIITSVLLAAILLSGCSKDKMQNRCIVGEWEITQYRVDGAGDLTETDLYTVITFEFSEDGDIEQFWQYDSNGETETNRVLGSYDLADEELDVDFDTDSASNFFTGNEGGTREVYDIVELTKTNFVLDGVFNGKTVEIRADKMD